MFFEVCAVLSANLKTLKKKYYTRGKKIDFLEREGEMISKQNIHPWVLINQGIYVYVFNVVESICNGIKYCCHIRHSFICHKYTFQNTFAIRNTCHK